MSRERLAAAYEELAALHARVAEQYAQVAHELMGTEPSAARADVAAGVPAGEPAAAAGAAPSAPAAASIDRTRCPAHNREWKEGTYGPYCTAQADDPAWANKKGYCNITPRSAPKWLEIHRVAA